MEFRGQEPVDEMGVVASGPPGAYAGALPRTHASASASASSGNEVGYRECLRNHAAELGGHVVDGCGEFMPGADALSCAACGCHRSFHRKDNVLLQQQEQQRRLLLPPAPSPLLLPPPHHPYAASHPHAPPFPYHHHHHRTPSVSGGTTTTESSSEEQGPPGPSAAQGRRKRFRTRFTAEQKAQMLAFAERVGWRMQKQDDALVEQFCAQAGVRRQVFKVWMHNNKQHSSSSSRQQQQQAAAAAGAAIPTSAAATAVAMGGDKAPPTTCT